VSLLFDAPFFMLPVTKPNLQPENWNIEKELNRSFPCSVQADGVEEHEKESKRRIGDYL
jgi:hypothetical protein